MLIHDSFIIRIYTRLHNHTIIDHMYIIIYMQDSCLGKTTLSTICYFLTKKPAIFRESNFIIYIFSCNLSRNAIYESLKLKLFAHLWSF
jgi:hypothetical protein